MSAHPAEDTTPPPATEGEEEINRVEIIHRGMVPVTPLFVRNLLMLMNEGEEQLAAEKALILMRNDVGAAREWLHVHKGDGLLQRPLTAHEESLPAAGRTSPVRDSLAARVASMPLRVDTSATGMYSLPSYEGKPMPVAAGSAPSSPLHIPALLAHRLQSPRFARPTPFPRQAYMVPPSPQPIHHFPYAPIASPHGPFVGRPAFAAPPSPAGVSGPMPYPMPASPGIPVSPAWISLGASKPSVPFAARPARVPMRPLVLQPRFHPAASPDRGQLTPHPASVRGGELFPSDMGTGPDASADVGASSSSGPDGTTATADMDIE